jgi:PGF-pre-PGF domain-containing protein
MNLKNKYFSKKILHRNLRINYFMIFLVLTILIFSFNVTSSTSTNNLDMNKNTTDSDSKTLVTGDNPNDSSIDSSVVDDNPTDSSDDSIVVDDKLSGSGDDSVVVDDKSSSSSGNSIVEVNKSSDSSFDSIIWDDNSTDSSNKINDNTSYYESIYKNSIYYEDTSSKLFASNERLVSVEEIESISENNLGDLNNEEEIEVIVKNFDDIDSVKLTTTTNLNEVKIKIIKLKDKPEEIIDPPKKNRSIYKYLDMKLIANDTYVEEDEIKSLEFKFKVEKAWINNNKIDKTTIRLIRYHDGEWQNLSTKLNSENNTYLYYSAESPGFSTFAVVGSKVVEKSESYGSEDIRIPWSFIFAFIILLTIILVVVLFKARYIYLKDDK